MEFRKLTDDAWTAGMQNELIREGAKAMLDRADELINDAKEKVVAQRENTQKETEDLTAGLE